jgi:hypothetical protein
MSSNPRAAETALVEAARTYLKARGYRAGVPHRLAMDFDGGGDLVEPPHVLLRPTEPPWAVDFVPNAFQKAILKALTGTALRTDALAAKVGDRRRLFREKGGLVELQERGKVKHNERLGFYRPDDPPDELRAEPGGVA